MVAPSAGPRSGFGRGERGGRSRGRFSGSCADLSGCEGVGISTDELAG